MARIETTIWELAMAVGEQAEASSDDRQEADDLAFCALVNLLHHSRLDDSPASLSSPDEWQLPAAG